MNSVVFTMNQHPGNTYIIDFIMNSIVFTMNYYPDNTYIIDFAMHIVVRFVLADPLGVTWERVQKPSHEKSSKTTDSAQKWSQNRSPKWVQS